MRHRCAICGKVHDETKMEIVDGYWLCKSCVPRCEDCGKADMYMVTMVFADGTSKRVCRECQFKYCYCDACHCWSEEKYEGPICPSCYEKGCRMCRECGSIFLSYNGEETYCDNCKYPRAIRNYSYDPNWSYLGGYGQKFDGFLRYGVELEVDDGHNPYACANMLRKISPYIYCKHDSSLSEVGFEIISYPATLDFHLHEMNWDTICRAAKSLYGYRSHDTRTCGLHIHVGMETFGRITDAKLVALTDALGSDMEVMARRQYNRYAIKSDAKIMSDDKPQIAVNKALMACGDEHHMAVSLCGKASTVEFRLFRGTLNPNTIKATLVFVDCLARYADSHTMKECTEATFADVAAMSHEPCFVDYVGKRMKGVEIADEKC